MNQIEFFSFKNAPMSLREEWMQAIKEVVESGQYIGGPVIEAFENEWAKYLGIKHAIGVGNGYDAIHVALKILGIGPGDVVAVPSHTFVASWLAIGATGATPIGIDCDEKGLMNLDQLEASDLNFKAVVPVHMHGQMVDMPRLIEWASQLNVRVVEDCAQAHGAKINGRMAGTWGDFGAFSFYPTKNLGAIGDAGALVTDSEELAHKAKSYINYGSTPGNKYMYQFEGVNSRLDPIQAAVLNVNLKYLDSWNVRRIQIARRYLKALNLLGIRTLPRLEESIFHHFVVLSNNRDHSRNLLLEHGVKTEIHYPECARISFGKFGKNSDKSISVVAEDFSKQIISLPISQWMQDSEVDYLLDIFSLESVRLSFNGEIR